MRDAGISPVIVSNVALSAQDRDKLNGRTSLIIERPNIGYDFGGYRDGVLHIRERLQTLDRLWLLNDSCWLVPQTESWFARARALGVDFACATYNNIMPRANPNDYKAIAWQIDRSRRNFYYASYALSFSANILKSEGFLKYWKTLDIRNDKGLTVRRGELGVSQWVIRRGFSHGCTLELDGLDRELEALSDSALDAILPHIVALENRELLELKNRVLTAKVSDVTRADKIAFILAAAARCGAVYALPAYSIPYRQFHFLKKLPLSLNEDGRDSTLAIARRIGGETGDMILREAALKPLKSG
nr:rhamnan synthesis F family protein [Rhizobium sp. L1K21]